MCYSTQRCPVIFWFYGVRVAQIRSAVTSCDPSHDPSRRVSSVMSLIVCCGAVVRGVADPQASAVANGGGYLLDQERDQEVAYEEEKRRRYECPSVPCVYGCVCVFACLCVTTYRTACISIPPVSLSSANKASSVALNIRGMRLIYPPYISLGKKKMIVKKCVACR